ncbi:uncharacterized protein [Triticum aestivum]|uniref:uncharacterized protein n=1 Tax=Triticum aestivum TaxID=4565 RepID=UPI001D028423|nr:uncharacterized protein LOC123133548 [Triticum aestivum]
MSICASLGKKKGTPLPAERKKRRLRPEPGTGYGHRLLIPSRRFNSGKSFSLLSSPGFVSPHLTGSNPSYLGFPPKLTPPTYIYLPRQLSRGGDLMMDAAAEVPQTICPEKKPRADFDGEAGRHSPAAVDPVSKVLEDNNLLAEILLRAGFPTTLVRAALVCRCWYHLASNQGFLRRFRELHPPRLLGFYIGSILIRPELVAFLCFVPMLPQPPELNIWSARQRTSIWSAPPALP